MPRHTPGICFLISLHDTPMTLPLCLYLHLHIHNVDQTVTKPNFPEVPQEQTQPYKQEKQNWKTHGYMSCQMKLISKRKLPLKQTVGLLLGVMRMYRQTWSNVGWMGPLKVTQPSLPLRAGPKPMLDDTFQGKRLCSAEQWVAETAGCLVQIRPCLCPLLSRGTQISMSNISQGKHELTW